jgi:hypothetical protein
MLRYRKSIKIEGWGDSKYEKEVHALLENVIGRNPVAKMILAHLDVLDHYLTIVPFSDADREKHGECDAFTEAANSDDASPEGVKYWEKNSDGTYTQSKTTGTGKGTEARIHFSPGMFGKGKCHGGLFGSMPDEVLFHEMVHGLRDIQGWNDQQPMGGGYDDQEEFLAIVITNIYMSAKTKSIKGLRANHDEDLQELKPPFNTSAGFLTDQGNLQKLVYFDRDEMLLFFGLGMIADFEAPFNPIGELENNLAKYRDLAWGRKRK